jgi:hypothetical protein
MIADGFCAASCHVQVGKKNRSVGATLMNQDSSRSHSVFSITIETIQQGPASVSSYSSNRACRSWAWPQLRQLLVSLLAPLGASAKLVLLLL